MRGGWRCGTSFCRICTAPFSPQRIRFHRIGTIRKGFPLFIQRRKCRRIGCRASRSQGEPCRLHCSWNTLCVKLLISPSTGSLPGKSRVLWIRNRASIRPCLSENHGLPSFSTQLLSVCPPTETRLWLNMLETVFRR